MDTLTGDLSGLIDEQLDAPTSSLLGISSGIEMFTTGYEAFDYKKNVKWLTYGIKKQNLMIVRFLLETQQYKTLEFMHEFYGTGHVKKAYYLMRLQKKILPPADVSFNSSELTRFIEQTIKDHWWEGTVYIHELMEISWERYSIQGVITTYAYKYGYLDAINLIYLVPTFEKLIGMITSDIDYGQQLITAEHNYIGDLHSECESFMVLREAFGLNRDLDFFLKRFGKHSDLSKPFDFLSKRIGKYSDLSKQITDMIWYINGYDNHNSMVTCFIRAIEHGNLVVANCIYDCYNALYLEELSEKQYKCAEMYREIINNLVGVSIAHNFPSIYEKYLGRVDNPVQSFYQKMDEDTRENFVDYMLNFGNYNIFNI